MTKQIESKTCFELRAALEACFLRQSQLAQLCGVKQVQVWRWCEGKAEIPAYVWTILALASGKKPFEVLFKEMPVWTVEKRHVYRGKDFKALAKRFHPDISGRDTTAEMQHINRFRGK